MMDFFRAFLSLALLYIAFGLYTLAILRLVVFLEERKRKLK